MAHDHLIAQLDQLQQQFGESHALLLADERQVLFGTRTDVLFPAASLIKLGIAAYVKAQA